MKVNLIHVEHKAIKKNADLLEKNQAFIVSTQIFLINEIWADLDTFTNTANIKKSNNNNENNSNGGGRKSL